MPRSLVPAALVLLGIAVGCFHAEAGSAAERPKRLADAQVGWSLVVPGGWRVGGRVVATQFASGARCRSVLVLDLATPPDSGPGPSQARSFVQVCARVRSDRRSLHDYLAEIYGDTFSAQFEPMRIAGRPSYRSRRSNPQLVFVQTGGHRLQLAASAASFIENRERRRAQVDRILRSFKLREPTGG